MDNLVLGFPVEMFTEDCTDDAICAICLLVCRDPRRPAHCDHSFCHTCIGRLIVMAGAAIAKCPMCRSDVGRHSDLRESNVTDHLRVRCFNLPQDDHKCDWKGPVSQANLHVRNDCLLTLLCCDATAPHGGKCDFSATRREYGSHNNECPIRAELAEINRVRIIFACLICNNDYECLCITCVAHRAENLALPGPCGIVASGSCGHQFHEHCIERWLRVRQTCPVCDTLWT